MANYYWDTNKVNGTELMAMRMMRGKTLAQMVSIVNSNKTRFQNYTAHSLDVVEKNLDEVPLDLVEIYMTELGITRSHMNQFKKILKGQLKTFTEDRQIPTKIKNDVKKKCKNRCVKCGSKQKLHFHHIEHFAKGGQNTVDNLILLCASCHAEEHKDERAYHALKKMAER